MLPYSTQKYSSVKTGFYYMEQLSLEHFNMGQKWQWRLLLHYLGRVDAHSALRHIFLQEKSQSFNRNNEFDNVYLSWVCAKPIFLKLCNIQFNKLAGQLCDSVHVGCCYDLFVRNAMLHVIVPVVKLHFLTNIGKLKIYDRSL